MADTSLKQTKPIAAYDQVREQLSKMLTPEMFGDPNATSAAPLKVVDAGLRFTSSSVRCCQWSNRSMKRVSTHGNSGKRYPVRLSGDSGWASYWLIGSLKRTEEGNT
jgi:hypothetical protein